MIDGVLRLTVQLTARTTLIYIELYAEGKYRHPNCQVKTNYKKKKKRDANEISFALF